jgi:hypothetical protein
MKKNFRGGQAHGYLPHPEVTYVSLAGILGQSYNMYLETAFEGKH